jgi:hypothetical protein
MPDIQTSGPGGRYGALLFCEKEGFNELFREVQLAEHYDLAIMSTKGVSVTAARRLVTGSTPAVRIASAPPVQQSGKFSLLFRAPEKRVISKALAEQAGYRPRPLKPTFPLSSAVFSKGWELRQFSTQL